jgi:hypothetical protein
VQAHRGHQVVDVQEQRHLAGSEDGRPHEQGNLPEVLPKVPDDDFALPLDPVDHHGDPLPGLSDHHREVPIPGPAGIGKTEEPVQPDERNRGLSQAEGLAPLQRDDVAVRECVDPVGVHDRKGEKLIAGEEEKDRETAMLNEFHDHPGPLARIG